MDEHELAEAFYYIMQQLPRNEAGNKAVGKLFQIQEMMKKKSEDAQTLHDIFNTPFDEYE